MEFVTTVAMEDRGTFDSFKPALESLMSGVKQLLDARQATPQVVETACWIQVQDEEYEVFPIMFYTARDIGYVLGLMRDGEMVLDAPEPHQQALRAAIALAHEIYANG